MLPQEERNVQLGMDYGDELIRIRGDHGLPYHLKANCYRQLGEFEKAKPLYEQSIKNRKGYLLKVQLLLFLVITICFREI